MTLNTILLPNQVVMSCHRGENTTLSQESGKEGRLESNTRILATPERVYVSPCFPAPFQFLPPCTSVYWFPGNSFLFLCESTLRELLGQIFQVYFEVEHNTFSSIGTWHRWVSLKVEVLMQVWDTLYLDYSNSREPVNCKPVSVMVGAHLLVSVQ